MALLEWKKDEVKVRIHESLEELSTDLADYIAELYEASIKDRGFFAIALSGGSLISLMSTYPILLLLKHFKHQKLLGCIPFNEAGGDIHLIQPPMQESSSKIA
nr:probable 6-phosphogluconolactonase 1 [Tanacetum cinerariifolium]